MPKHLNMGYRTYIGSISKTEYDKIKSFNSEESKAYFNRDDVRPYQICQEIYEFGKYTEFDDVKFLKPFWENKEVQSNYGDFWITDKEYLRHIIEHYKGKVIKFYNRLLDCPATDRKYEKQGLLRLNENELNNVEKDKLKEWFDHIRDMRLEWTQGFAFDLSEDTQVITSSWKYEYSIFELVRIYKTFDWENNHLVYYGY